MAAEAPGTLHNWRRIVQRKSHNPPHLVLGYIITAPFAELCSDPRDLQLGLSGLRLRLRLSGGRAGTKELVRLGHSQTGPARWELDSDVLQRCARDAGANGIFDGFLVGPIQGRER